MAKVVTIKWLVYHESEYKHDIIVNHNLGQVSFTRDEEHVETELI
jgi:hypothetical protein